MSLTVSKTGKTTRNIPYGSNAGRASWIGVNGPNRELVIDNSGQKRYVPVGYSYHPQSFGAMADTHYFLEYESGKFGIQKDYDDGTNANSYHHFRDVPSSHLFQKEMIRRVYYYTTNPQDDFMSTDVFSSKTANSHIHWGLYSKANTYFDASYYLKNTDEYNSRGYTLRLYFEVYISSGGNWYLVGEKTINGSVNAGTTIHDVSVSTYVFASSYPISITQARVRVSIGSDNGKIQISGCNIYDPLNFRITYF
ncbi:MAG: hypothetical protein ACOC3V_03780 [bacterium]